MEANSQNNGTTPTTAPPTSGDSAPSGSSSRGRGRFDRGRVRGYKGKDLHRGGRGGRGGSKGRSTEDGRPQPRNNVYTKRWRVDEDGNSRGTATAEDGPPVDTRMSIHFSAEEIAAESRRPKRKVAVLIGYAGTGYKGMQINHTEKTIEGDLFAAFVATGAIAKTNADDPKKSGLMRCARTDKGVHAAGNVISLKLVVEEDDIKEKINAALPPQIRIWDIQRTNNSFSCYTACDSRWYEYLLPSYALLPPRPDSFLGKNVVEAATEKDTLKYVEEQWEDVATFWADVEREEIEPILAACDNDLRQEVLQLLQKTAAQEAGESALAETGAKKEKDSGDSDEPEVPGPSDDDKVQTETPGDWVVVEHNTAASAEAQLLSEAATHASDTKPSKRFKPSDREPTPAEAILYKIKAAYVAAKRRYRVTPTRLQQLQSALNKYVGTHNFHNYTIQKAFRDPSAKRHIKSFLVNPEPLQIGDTQWLSLKVHGQSFMMHQIRKMVAMAVLVVRCATPLERMEQSFGPRPLSVPKAPSLGLLLERPVFESYNSIVQENFGKDKIDFSKYEKEMDAFKQEQIYTRIFKTEEYEGSFSTFFNMLDNFQADYFLWVTARGLDAAYERKEYQAPVPKALEDQLGDEGDVQGVEEG